LNGADLICFRRSEFIYFARTEFIFGYRTELFCFTRTDLIWSNLTELLFAEEQIRERKEKEEYERQSSYAIHRELVILALHPPLGFSLLNAKSVQEIL
jgi:hypothetical protein